jgi:molybdopterin adenylyltransferase
MNGKLLAVCLSKKKGTQKEKVERATLRAGHGIEGDAHAGPWHRQISILSESDIDGMRQKGLELAPGAFAENLVVDGLNLIELGLGSRLRVGAKAELSVSQIGKVCHSHCAIYSQAGDCIMPRVGLFARCVEGGEIASGDEAEVLEQVSRKTIQAVVLTISDRCSRGEAEDTAGPAAETMLREELGAHVYRRKILPDDKNTIIETLSHYSDGHSIDLVFTVGGTGMSPRDVTPEATLQVAERMAPGLAEAMRAASLLKTPRAMLSRGICGIRGTTLIVNLPGSKRGARENLQAILPALGHAVQTLRGEPVDCGRPEKEQR